MGWRSLLSRGEDERLLQAQRETNDLLRELIRATTGRPATTKPSLPTPQRIRDEKDITVVSRQSVLGQEQEARAKRAAPWRDQPPVNGQASAPQTSNSGDPAQSPALPRVVL